MKLLTVLLLGALACAHIPVIGPAFDAKDRWVYGTLVRIEENDDYQQGCRLFCRLMGGQEGPRAYEAVVVDTIEKKHRFMFFAPKGNRIPVLGTVAHWHLHPMNVKNFSKANAYLVPEEFTWVLTSDEDIVQ